MSTLLRNRSRDLYEKAQKLLPGGVNSPVRAYRAVGGEPLFIQSGKGAMLQDVDGNRYIDFVASWGPLILGHAHPRVTEAISLTAAAGTSFGAPCELEIELARLVNTAFPSMEMVRMVNSGTEAAMSVIRLARGFTGRDKILKFTGCYHGHVDSLLVKAGSGALTLGVPDSAGVPHDLAKHTLVVPFNDQGAVHDIIEKYHRDIAALIVEPVPANMGVVPPRPGFLQFLRDITAAHGIVLIFDEVITGFRVAFGGVQETEGIRADLTMLGKIIGGGLPVGAYGGRRDIMEKVSPLGPVYQAGTLSGNPLAMAAGLETLRIIQEDSHFYQRLEQKGQQLAAALEEAARAAGIPVTTNRVGSMLTAFFCEGPVASFADAMRADTARYGRFFRGMLAEGVALAPSQFEAAFIGGAHQDEHLTKAAAAASRVLAAMQDEE
jgi:glutamate-1-semialdehyde 2,1-aminomutase